MSLYASKTTAQIDRDVSGYFAVRWTGKAPLWKAFWIDFVFLGQAIAGTCYFGLIILIGHFSSLQFWPISKVMSYYLVSSSLFMVVFFVVSVFVWKCAPNTGRPLWGYFSRAIVAIELILFSLKYLGFVYAFYSIVDR